MYYMINGKNINESGSLSCSVCLRQMENSQVWLKKTTQTTQSDMAVTANRSRFCLRKKTKKQKASLTVFSPDECCVCLSNGDIILTFTLTMHIQLQNNCTYGRYCDDKISDMYPNTYELQVIK